MMRFPANPLDPGYGNLLPFLAAAILVAIALQAKLLSFKPTPIEFPPQFDEITLPGALPQFSAPPDLPEERDIVQPTVLPVEAMPNDLAAQGEAPSVAATAPEFTAPLGGAGVPTAIGIPTGAGNLHIRTSRPATALSALSENLMQQIKRLHPLPPPVRAKRPTVSLKAGHPVGASLPAGNAKARPAALGVGGPSPSRNALGGLSQLAAKDAPVINGTTFKRRF
jgi:hypothetical protein